MKNQRRLILSILGIGALVACALPAPLPLTPSPVATASAQPSATAQAPATANAAPTGGAPRLARTRAAETRGAQTPPTDTPAPPAAPTSTLALTPAALDPLAIPPSFFAMNTVDAADYPQIPFGTLGHPGVGVWAWIERQKGVYDFSLVDAYVNAAAQHGLEDATHTVSMALTLGYTPAWYASDPSSCKPYKASGISQCTSAPSNVQDWANYVTAVVSHYNGVTAPHIRYYELWNEFNISLFYTGTPAELVSLAKAAYPIVHTDSHSMLLTPSVAGPVGNLAKSSGTTWMAIYLDAGGAKYADGGAFHGYIAEQTGVTSFPMPDDDSPPGCKVGLACYGSIVAKATQMRQTFDQHGLAGKPMFDTEGSWGNGTVTDPQTQVAWLARWYLLQAGLRSTDNLQLASWFTWGDPKTFHWGTIETDATAPSEAGVAYAQVYAWLVGANMSKPCSSASDGTWTCALTRGGGYRGLAIWNTQGSKAYQPGNEFIEYRDLAGQSTAITAGKPVSIGAQPILLETQALH